MRTRIFVATTALSFLAASRAEAASMYTITDLGTLPGATSSIATGINDAGQVVGYSGNNVSYSFTSADPYLAGSNPQSFLYSNGQLSQIANPYNGTYGNLPAGSINDSGQVAAVNQSINASGQVVSNLQPFQVPVATTTNGVTTTTPVSFTPVAINDNGQIAGSLTPPGTGYSDAGIYQNGKFFDISRALGLTGDVTTAAAINNAGSVLVSDFHPSSDLTSYLIYKADGTTQALPGGLYTAMNNNGQAVNFFGNLGVGSLYSNGTSTPLTDLIPPSSQSFWTFLNPLAINDEGQIVGFGGPIGGPTHAFLMTPTTAPEPSSLSFAWWIETLAFRRRL